MVTLILTCGRVLLQRQCWREYATWSPTDWLPLAKNGATISQCTTAERELMHTLTYVHVVQQLASQYGRKMDSAMYIHMHVHVHELVLAWITGDTHTVYIVYMQ